MIKRFRKYRCFAVAWLCFGAIAATGQSHQASHKSASRNRAVGSSKIDVCTLLTSAEIAAVQGEAVTATKPSPEHSSGLQMSQCLFQTATAAKSVNLAVALPGKKKDPAPRKFWQRQFHSSSAKDDAEGRVKPGIGAKPQGEKEGSAPQAVAGLGDEAFWMSSPVAGALYVLRGEKFFRISVGGSRKPEERLQRSTALARNILARLR